MAGQTPGTRRARNPAKPWASELGRPSFSCRWCIRSSSPASSSAGPVSPCCYSKMAHSLMSGATLSAGGWPSPAGPSPAPKTPAAVVVFAALKALARGRLISPPLPLCQLPAPRCNATGVDHLNTACLLEQRTSLAMIYTVASTIFVFSLLPGGVMLDRCGAACTSTVAGVAVSSGFAMVACGADHLLVRIARRTERPHTRAIDRHPEGYRSRLLRRRPLSHSWVAVARSPTRRRWRRPASSARCVSALR